MYVNMYIQWAVPTINNVNMYIQWAMPTINPCISSEQCLLLMYVNMYIQWAVPTINACKHVYPVSSAYY